MARFKVEVKHSASGGVWEDVTAYIVPVWDAGVLVAERTCLQTTAGAVAFTLVDRDTDKAAHYWVERLATSTTVPEVRLSAVTNETTGTTQELFYGRIEPDMFTYDGDVLTGFTACPLLQWADKVDVYPAAGGQGVTSQYSGKAETLLTTLLRKLGCQAGSVADVEVKDYALGAAQTDADWNHTRRHWAGTGVAVDADGVSDLLPAPEASEARAFVLKHGRLYAVTLTGGLAEVLNSSSQPYTTTGHRLFRFVCPGGAEGFAIVEARLRSSWTRQTQPWGGAQYVSAALSLAGLAAAMFVPGLGQLAKLGLLAAGAAAGYGVNELTKSINDSANADSFWAATGVRVLDIGNGTSGPGGVGRGFNAAFSLTNTPYVWTPADSVSTAQVGVTPNSSPGEVYYAVWRAAERSVEVWQAFYTAGGTWDKWMITHPRLNNCGIPVGGMAAVGWTTANGYRTLILGTASGYVLMTQDAAMRWRQWTILRKEPPSRFCVALGNDYSGLKLAHFVYGNGAENTNGQALVITKIAGTTTPPTETLVSGMPDSTDRVLHAGPAHYQIAGYTYATGVYQHRDSEGRVLLYAGGLRVQSGSTAVEFDGQFCQYPLPDSGRDWRPPMLWFDNSQAVYRLLTCCCWLDRDRLVTDFASTSLYAQAYIHHDFARDRRSIGQVLAEAQRSFWLYLRLGSLDPCNDADDVRVVS
ncbi:hypothetical protein FJY71_05875, partial [candidate division WOR-3 bacterium]|nr:hypothetical protein [candidate division WOR-3 bacterium]